MSKFFRCAAPPIAVRILVDMDGVLADFEAHFLARWIELYPGRLYVSLEERRTFKVKDQYPKEYWEDIEAVYCRPGFYRSLPVIAGCVSMKLSGRYRISIFASFVPSRTEVRTVFEVCPKSKCLVVEVADWVKDDLPASLLGYECEDGPGPTIYILYLRPSDWAPGPT